MVFHYRHADNKRVSVSKKKVSQLKVSHEELSALRSLPLDVKIGLSKTTIQRWYEYWNGNVYVSFSGGKDSTVLLNLVRQIYPDVPAVFCNTGTELPEIVDFVSTFNNVVVTRPTKSFGKIIHEYGYPVVSKEVSQGIHEVRNTKSDKLRYKRLFGADNKYKSGKIPEKWKFLIDAPFKISSRCCYYLKKKPADQYGKGNSRYPFIGIMTEDSPLRRQTYMRHSCNAYDTKRPRSTPIAFWTTSDIWNYIHENGVPYCSIYDMGWENTGCAFCLFGVHKEEEPNRFQRIQVTHPELWKACIGWGIPEVLDYIGVSYDPVKQPPLPAFQSKG